MQLQNGYKIIYSIRDKHGVEHFYAGKGVAPSKHDDVMVMVANNKIVYGGEKDEEVVIANGVTTEDLLKITENGEYNIANYKRVEINVAGMVPTGTLNITANGEYDVTEKAGVDVNVPIPSGYIVPEGNLNITANGTNIDVTAKATVSVAVPNPSTGTKNITTNGTHDVTDFASANVNVPIPAGYIIPSGKLEITEAGTDIDVTNYAAVDVTVPSTTLDSYSILITDNEGEIEATATREYSSTVYWTENDWEGNPTIYHADLSSGLYRYCDYGDTRFDSVSLSQGLYYYGSGCDPFEPIYDVTPGSFYAYRSEGSDGFAGGFQYDEHIRLYLLDWDAGSGAMSGVACDFGADPQIGDEITVTLPDPFGGSSTNYKITYLGVAE